MKTSQPAVTRSSAIVFLPVICAWLLLMANTGCIMIPLPSSESGYARTNLNQRTVKQFTPGQTTFEDVIWQLGEPDAVSADEHLLAYRSERITGMWIGFLSDDTFLGPIYKSRIFYFEFNGQGRLKLMQQESREDLSPKWPIDEMTDKMINETHRLEPRIEGPSFPEQTSTWLSIHAAGEPVWRVYKKCGWLVDATDSGLTFPHRQIPGWLLLTESNLFYVTIAQFANADAALKLPWASIAEVSTFERYFDDHPSWLVVRTKDGKSHAFAIYARHGYSLDSHEIESACNFIRSQIGPVQPEK
jgi:hypothetical protein